MDKIFLEIRAGAGGEEACLFVSDLARMYQRYADIKKWSFTILDFHQSSLKGYKSFTAVLQGDKVYDELKQESGVHRVQRVPLTEKSGRIHTSTVSVAILPNINPSEVKINPSDLEISFFRSSGPGGQNVNKVETAVRIVHRPSCTIVSSQMERSQSRNRERALEILRAKLYEQEKKKREEEIGGIRKEQIGSSQRAEKIRTYNFPQDRITDHRLGKKWSNLEEILNGRLDRIVKNFSESKE